MTGTTSDHPIVAVAPSMSIPGRRINRADQCDAPNQRVLPFSPPRPRRKVFTVYTVIRSIEVGLMARIDLFAKIPLIGMSLVFLAMFIVAVTAYLHAGWYSIIGYAIAAVVAVAGFVMTFRDVRDTPGPPEHWDARGNPVDPASPGN